MREAAAQIGLFHLVTVTVTVRRLGRGGLPPVDLDDPAGSTVGRSRAVKASFHLNPGLGRASLRLLPFNGWGRRDSDGPGPGLDARPGLDAALAWAWIGDAGLTRVGGRWPRHRRAGHWHLNSRADQSESRDKFS
jgi:hypothetical protein